MIVSSMLLLDGTALAPEVLMAARVAGVHRVFKMARAATAWAWVGVTAR